LINLQNCLCLTPLGMAVILMGCQSQPSVHENRNVFSVTERNVSIGGDPVFTLSHPLSRDQLELLSVDILPGRAMNVYQMKAHLPGKGDVDVLVSPPLMEAVKLMNGGPDDLNGNQSFQMGGAILLPFANRIRGKLSPDRKTELASIAGKDVTLVANWKGKNSGAVPHAMHGLILASPMTHLKTDAGADQASISGSVDAGNFSGHWPSQTHVDITATLKHTAFELSVTARNAGSEELPMGIGWHPYFALPSGDRQQARLRLPATERALVNNYDDVFPTGKIVPVKDTPYDFTSPGGSPLNQLFLDDCFLNLQKSPDGRAVAEIIDPAAKYGVRITALSPQVSAFQVYAPPNRQMIVVEPQFNLADPYHKVWRDKVNTGMVLLKPGESVTYAVRVELFSPAP
jgi:aldose 1-epimerase